MQGKNMDMVFFSDDPILDKVKERIWTWYARKGMRRNCSCLGDKAVVF